MNMQTCEAHQLLLLVEVDLSRYWTTCWIWEELLPTLPLFQYTCGAPQKGPSRMLVATESISIYTFLHSNLLVCVPSPKPGGLGTNNCWPSLQAVAAWYVFEALVFAKKHAPPWFALPCSRAMKPAHRIVRLCLLGPSTCTVYYICLHLDTSGIRAGRGRKFQKETCLQTNKGKELPTDLVEPDPIHEQRPRISVSSRKLQWTKAKKP